MRDPGYFILLKYNLNTYLIFPQISCLYYTSIQFMYSETSQQYW